jgi:hypothetical protein
MKGIKDIAGLIFLALGIASVFLILSLPTPYKREVIFIIPFIFLFAFWKLALAY